MVGGCKKEETNPVQPTPAKAAPQLSEPADSSVDVLTEPWLTWFVVDEAETYRFQVSTSANFEILLFNQNVSVTEYQLTGLTKLKQYFWRVRSANKNGNSAWSQTRTFITTLGTVPQKPTLIYPANVDTGVSITPKLRWAAVEGAVNYAVQISTSSSFATIRDSATTKDTTYTAKALDSSTVYYWRVITGNRYGEISSSANAFYTYSGYKCGPIVYAGKTYNTVQIGSQCWLKENLDVGVYVASTNTGSLHSDVSNNGIIEKYCYENNQANCATYGGLYDWKEAMGYVITPGTRGICPSGWHIPTYAEFQALGAAVGNNSNALKAEGQGTGSGAGTNASGFSALLAGIRSYRGGFSDLSNYANFWGSTANTWAYANVMGLLTNGSDIDFYRYYSTDCGFSVRCVKD